MGTLNKIFLQFDEMFWDDEAEWLSFVKDSRDREELSSNAFFLNLNHYYPGL
jgi:hypothetical protein